MNMDTEKENYSNVKYFLIKRAKAQEEVITSR